MERSESDILITGASGLSGRIVVKEFLNQNIPIRVLVRNEEKAADFRELPGTDVFVGNMLYPETLSDALRGVNKALLISSAGERLFDTQKSFIDAAKQAGVPHVVKFSGADSGIGFNAQNFISQKIHENVEDYLVNSGLRWTIVRPSQFMQFYLPGTPTGVNLEKNALILATGKGVLSPIAIEDVAKVCLAILTQPGHENHIYEMTGPDALTMQEVCEIISDITNREITYKDIPLDDYRNLLKNKGLHEDRIRILSEINKERSKCIESHIKLGTHKRFGVRPTNFAEFIFKNKQKFLSA